MFMFRIIIKNTFTRTYYYGWYFQLCVNNFVSDDQYQLRQVLERNNSDEIEEETTEEEILDSSTGMSCLKANFLKLKKCYAWFNICLCLTYWWLLIMLSFSKVTNEEVERRENDDDNSEPEKEPGMHKIGFYTLN